MTDVESHCKSVSTATPDATTCLTADLCLNDLWSGDLIALREDVHLYHLQRIVRRQRKGVNMPLARLIDISSRLQLHSG